MDSKFKTIKMSGPMYGSAPAELVQAHQEIVEEMGRLFDSGASLSSDELATLQERANQLESQIMPYLDVTDGDK